MKWLQGCPLFFAPRANIAVLHLMCNEVSYISNIFSALNRDITLTNEIESCKAYLNQPGIDYLHQDDQHHGQHLRILQLEFPSH